MVLDRTFYSTYEKGEVTWNRSTKIKNTSYSNCMYFGRSVHYQEDRLILNIKNMSYKFRETGVGGIINGLSEKD